MKNVNLLSISIVVTGFILSSCGETKNKAENIAAVAAADTTPVNQEAEFKFQFAIGNLPGSSEVLDEISKADLSVHTELLNPTANADKYTTNSKFAYNFGIYGVDLGYLVVNSRLPDMIDYLSCTKKVASKLNLGEIYDAYVTRFESNRDNKDSLKKINDEAFVVTEKYLKTNERLVAATQVLTGSWLEGQYLTVNLLKDEQRSAKNEALYERIYEQGLHLDHIIQIYNELKSDQELMEHKTDLDALLAFYKELHSSKDVTKDYLIKLAAKLGDVRQKIIG